MIRTNPTYRHVELVRIHYLSLRRCCCIKSKNWCIICAIYCFLINCLTSTQSTLGMLSKPLIIRRSQYAPIFLKRILNFSILIVTILKPSVNKPRPVDNQSKQFFYLPRNDRRVSRAISRSCNSFLRLAAFLCLATANSIFAIFLSLK